MHAVHSRADTGYKLHIAHSGNSCGSCCCSPQSVPSAYNASAAQLPGATRASTNGWPYAPLSACKEARSTVLPCTDSAQGSSTGL